jgi:gamma-resorcylate decarboxylase
VDGKITLEDHFATEDTLADSKGYLPDSTWPDLSHRLTDFQDTRLGLMDRHGIGMMILSLNAPAVQAIPDPKQAIDVARRANDLVAEEVAKRPDRFASFAALAMQDPDAAARELERSVKDLKLVGALVNGFSQVNTPDSCVYYDLPQYRDFWGVVEKLDVPFYLHPRNPLPSWTPQYDGHRWLMGPTWAFAAETAVHALRLIGSGLFDTYPRLKIILGHLGEGLPYNLWRIDNRNGWVKPKHKYAAQKRVADYFRANFYMTTSGNFSTSTMVQAMAEVGADRIMFSVDYPFEGVDEGADWIDNAAIGEADRVKIARTNALKLFKLPGG